MVAGNGATRPFDLPELKPALLDAGSLERFFTDLAFETTVLQILLKGGDAQRSDPQPTLREARDAFTSATVTGLQVRYVHRGVEWWDTLMHTHDGVRIVRIRK